MPPSVEGASAAPTGVGPGTMIGGRFRIERAHQADPIGQLWISTDDKTGKQVAIRTLSTSLPQEVYGAVRAAVKQTARLRHRNIAVTYGLGTQDGLAFLAHEWLDGTSVEALVQQRQTTGQPLALRNVFNIIAHLCKGLSALHGGSFHGTVRPQVVWLTRSGRVKLTEVGLGQGLATTGTWTHLEAEQQAYLAPEVRSGKGVDQAADVFGVGSVMYALLTGRSPLEQFVPPSQVHPSADARLDGVLLQCLAANPAERYANPDDIVRALLPLVGDAPEPAPQTELGQMADDVELDVDIAASLPPAARSSRPAAQQATHPMPAPVTTYGAGPGQPPPAQATLAGAAGPLQPSSGHSVPVDVSLTPKPLEVAQPAPQPVATAHQPHQPAQPTHAVPDARRDSPAVPLAPPQAVAATGAAGGAAGAGDLDRVAQALGIDPTARWMVSKDGMDHGPFSVRELLKLIVDGEVLEQHVVLNMGTNERRPLSEYDEFADFVAEQREKRAAAEHAAALARSDKVEKRSKFATYFVIAGVVAAALAAGGTYLLTRERAAEVARSDLDLAALYESGNVKIQGTAGILKYTRPPAGAARKPKARKSGGGAGGFNSYEDAMNTAMELGDASRGGGERQLTSADVAGTMNRNLNSLFGCVSQELRRGGRLKSVVINMAIKGSGSVMGASVTTGSGAFKGCIVGKVRRIKFPSFPAPRMGARYSFDVD